jgi:hypothetical protein
MKAEATITATVVTIHRKTKCRTLVPYAKSCAGRNRFAKIHLPSGGVAANGHATSLKTSEQEFQNPSNQRSGLRGDSGECLSPNRSSGVVEEAD